MRRLLLFILICISARVSAQFETTLPSLERLQQSSFVNPAVIPSYNLSIGMPVNFQANVNLKGFSVGDITSSISNNKVVMDKFYSRLSSSVIGLHAGAGYDPVNVRFAVGNVYLGIHLGVRVAVDEDFSKDLFGFLAHGNSHFRGKTMDFSAVRTNAIAYMESGVSVAKEFKRFSIGARFKYLQGIATASTEEMTFKVTTGQQSTDPISIRLSGTINTSGIPVITDSVNGQPASKKDTTFDAADLSSFNNHGWAVDLGMRYYASQRLFFDAAISDLGSITWKQKTFNYNIPSVNIEHSGFNDEQLFKDSATSAYLDSLVNLIDTNITRNSFRTMLPLRFMLAGYYDLTLRDRVGLMMQGRVVNEQLFTAFTASYTRRFGTNWDVTTNYSVMNGGFVNLGLGTAVKWGAFQIYFMQDDILMYLLPEQGRNIYLRMGCNLVWGNAVKRSRLN